ncbi:MAG: hypothetical protein RBU25_04965 [Lentisphaeria bacterium]|jgi:hypothetical protein|nr:hypothetical protein [Lentisphaeria bacterium]
MATLEHIIVGVIVLFCLIYAVRKIIGILRGKECDGCSFCPSHGDKQKDSPCALCAHQADCEQAKKDKN